LTVGYLSIHFFEKNTCRAAILTDIALAILNRSNFASKTKPFDSI
jgi:hypothetical protein